MQGILPGSRSDRAWRHGAAALAAAHFCLLAVVAGTGCYAGRGGW